MFCSIQRETNDSEEREKDSYVDLTTRNSVLSTRSLPSVSNILNAIRKPDLGSARTILARKCEMKMELIKKINKKKSSFVSVE